MGFARSLMRCPRLEMVRLAGPQLQKAFFEEIECGLAGVRPLPQRTCWSAEWTWWVEGASQKSSRSTACDELLQRVADVFAHRGASLHVQADLHPPPDFRLTCESVAFEEQKPT